MMRRIARADLTEAPIPLGEHGALQEVAERLAEHRAYHAALSQAEGDIVSIVERAARAVVAAELAQTPEQIRHIVAFAMRSVSSARRLTIQVHPADLVLLPTAVDLSERLALGGSVELVAVPELGRGDCVILSELGEVDARLETKFRQLQRVLSKQVQP